MKQTTAQATDRPALFDACYWGAFRYPQPGIDASIIDNRNRFAIEYRLRARSYASTEGIHIDRTAGEDFDHRELYRTHDGRLVLVCSNYGGAHPPAALGMNPTPPIYAVNVASYVVTFDSVKAMRAAIRKTLPPQARLGDAGVIAGDLQSQTVRGTFDHK